MGVFHKEITVEKGLKAFVNGRRGGKKVSGRSPENMTVIQVRDMVIGPAAGGQLVVRSSNVGEEPTYGAGWKCPMRDRITTRLRDSDGGRKVACSMGFWSARTPSL